MLIGCIILIIIGLILLYGAIACLFIIKQMIETLFNVIDEMKKEIDNIYILLDSKSNRLYTNIKNQNTTDSKITDILILCRKAKNSFKNLSTDISIIRNELKQIKPQTALKNDFRSEDDDDDLDAYNL